MPLLPRLSSLWRNLFHQAQKEQELTAELDAYLEMLIEQKIAGGLDPAAARRAALVELGGRDQIKERVREARMGHEVETFWRDLGYALRMLRRNPGFAAVAVLSLALGIGANTAIFSLIDALLLKMLPVEQPEQLYLIQNVGSGNQTGTAPPYPCFEQFRQQSQSFNGLAAFTTQKPKLRIDGQLEEVSGQFVSGNYFSLLGVRAAFGRTLSPADDTVPGRGGPDGLN